MVRLSLLVTLVCVTGLAVGFPSSSEDDSDVDIDHSDELDSELERGSCIEELEKFVHNIWTSFKAHNNLTFSRNEERRRLPIFRKVLERIRLHNLKADLGLFTYQIGLSALAILTEEEMRNMKGSLPKQNRHATQVFKATLDQSSLPASVDWVQKGWVTPVKNQGQCGCCYTFASTGALEGQLMNTTNTLVSLSEQNLVDCSIPQGNHGCNGGVTDYCFQYVKSNGGIDSEASYPYTGKQGQCKYSASSAVHGAVVKSWVDVQRGSCAALMQAVAFIGPTTVAIDASQAGFQCYKTGVYSCTKPPQLDHAVLLVGYGVTSCGQKYWLVKNSWGTTWGQGGYIWIAQSTSSNPYADCGITLQASVPYSK